MKRINRGDNQTFSVFEVAFRPFFLLAGISSLYYMIIWTAYYSFQLNLNFQSISPTMWHAHEMLFGYTAAVIAGFLLTVEKYWLGVEINKKFLLVSLLTLWVLARVFLSVPLFSGFSYIFGAVIDCLFFIVLAIRVLYPILSAKAWDKTVLAAHLAIIAASNVIFYLGLFGIIPNGQRLGVYAALYVVISIILLMGRRMTPIFIRNALMEFKFEPKNHRVVDILSILFFILFFILELFFNSGKFVLIIAGILAVLYSLRLYGWYSNKILDKPLLWVMFAAYSWIVVGFALIFLSQFFNIPAVLSVHSFTYGGIGLMTIGFMSRVILGHTGRNVFDPPNIVFWIFAILLTGAVVRVFLPLIDMSNYRVWIGASQLLWIVSFLIFAALFFPMLLRPALEKKS